MSGIQKIFSLYYMWQSLGILVLLRCDDFKRQREMTYDVINLHVTLLDISALTNQFKKSLAIL